MKSMLMAAIPWWAQTLAVVFFIVCLLLIVIVLLQKGRGGGLSGAFGGAGGQSAFGSKTGDVFTWITIVIVTVFLLMAIVLTVSYRPSKPVDYIPTMTTDQPLGEDIGDTGDTATDETGAEPASDTNTEKQDDN